MPWWAPLGGLGGASLCRSDISKSGRHRTLYGLHSDGGADHFTRNQPLRMDSHASAPREYLENRGKRSIITGITLIGRF